MKLLHTISSFDVFGPEKTIINECLAFEEKGWKCKIINIWEREDIPFTAKVKASGVSYECLTTPKKLDLNIIRKLRKILKIQNVDIIHSHGYKADLYSLLASLRINIPLVTTIHGWTSENIKVKIYERIQVFIWRFFQKVICVSNAYRKVALSYNVPKEKLLVIYNGIKREKRNQIISREEVHKILSIEGEKIVVAIIGRIGIEKGHRAFLNAARRILEKRDNLAFVIIGEGAERKEMEKYARELGIQKDVIFTGHRDDVISLYNGIDIIGITSLREGLPNVLLEAMMNQVPVVAMSVGGIPEVIISDKQGILVQPKDIEAFTQGVESLIIDSSKRKRIGIEAKKRIEKKFLFSQRVNAISELYNKLITNTKLV